MRILVVEDEVNLNDIITKRLKNVHYSVDSCFNGQEAHNYILCAEYDAIILDIMLPLVNGFELLKRIRSENNKTPVLLLTALSSIDDRVRGLDSGADDYLTKPFAFDELLARLRVMLRRASDNVSELFTADDLTVDCSTRTVARGEVQIELSSKEFDILEYMIRNKGVVLTREKIINHIWNYDYDGASNLIDVYIRYLRRKIDDGCDNKLIKTIRGTGYVLRGEL